MTLSRALAVLDERQETKIRLGLARIRRHLARLGDPQERYETVHVAGTNGKGSVCAMLDSVLRESGLKVGLYLSPHLEDVRERIRVNGEWIPPKDFGRLMQKTLRHEGRDPLTYFELLTSIAFQYFAERKVDVAVLETGLGGRFDATNVVRRPLATIIPSIDYDHMNFLGKTLSRIAREKAGIFKKGCPALTAETKAEPLKVLRRTAERLRAPFVALPDDGPWRPWKIDWKNGRQIIRGPGGRRLRVGILGVAQARNAALVGAAAGWLRAQNVPISEEAFERGLAKVRWPARFEIVRRGSRVAILDGAHNLQAMRHFKSTLESSPWNKRPKRFVLGFLRDKEHRKMIQLIAPMLKEAIATEPPSPRALSAGELAAEIKAAAPAAKITVLSDPNEALRVAFAARSPRAICVCGSFYLAGLARRQFA